MQTELILVELHYPGLPPTLAGFFLVSPAEQRVAWRFLSDWRMVGDETDRRVLAGTIEMIASLAGELGFERCLQMLEDQWSNVLRLANRLAFNRPEMDLDTCADTLATFLLSEPK